VDIYHRDLMHVHKSTLGTERFTTFLARKRALLAYIEARR
jgi:hypothetical protein